MVTVILVVVVFVLIMALLTEGSEPFMSVGAILGLIVGVILAFALGSSVPKIATVTESQLMPIYGEGTQIYLKSVVEGDSALLLYHIDVDGVPREGKFGIGSRSAKVRNDLVGDEVPYMEHETYRFRDDWMKLFVFGPGGPKDTFHIPVGGADIDINDLLK